MFLWSVCACCTSQYWNFWWPGAFSLHHTEFLLTSNYFVLQILSGGTTPFANSLSTPKCSIGSELGCLRTTSPSITTQRMLEDRFHAFTCYDLSVSSIILLYIAKSSLLRVICHFVFLFRPMLLQRITSPVSQLKWDRTTSCLSNVILNQSYVLLNLNSTSWQRLSDLCLRPTIPKLEIMFLEVWPQEVLWIQTKSIVENCCLRSQSITSLHEIWKTWINIGTTKMALNSWKRIPLGGMFWSQGIIFHSALLMYTTPDSPLYRQLCLLVLVLKKEYLKLKTNK